MKIYYKDRWFGGARLDLLHDAGYLLGIDRHAADMTYEIWFEDDEGSQTLVVDKLNEEEMNRYVSLLIGSDDE